MLRLDSAAVAILTKFSSVNNPFMARFISWPVMKKKTKDTIDVNTFQFYVVNVNVAAWSQDKDVNPLKANHQWSGVGPEEIEKKNSEALLRGKFFFKKHSFGK